MFLAYPYWAGMLAAQWSPLLFACASLPWVLPAVLAKPQIGLPVALTHLTRRGVIGCVLVLACSLAIRPRWPLEWFAGLGTYDHFIPLLLWPGPLLLLALLRWRNRDHQFLLLMAAVPQRWFYDQLVLWLIPKSRREILATVLSSWAPACGAGTIPRTPLPRSDAGPCASFISRCLPSCSGATRVAAPSRLDSWVFNLPLSRLKHKATSLGLQLPHHAEEAEFKVQFERSHPLEKLPLLFFCLSFPLCRPPWRSPKAALDRSPCKSPEPM